MRKPRPESENGFTDKSAAQTPVLFPGDLHFRIQCVLYEVIIHKIHEKQNCPLGSPPQSLCMALVFQGAESENHCPTPSCLPLATRNQPSVGGDRRILGSPVNHSSPISLCSQPQHSGALGTLTWWGQVDHISIANVDGPVSVERAENLNQVSRLGLWLQNQEECCFR